MDVAKHTWPRECRTRPKEQVISSSNVLSYLEILRSTLDRLERELINIRVKSAAKVSVIIKMLAYVLSVIYGRMQSAWVCPNRRSSIIWTILIWTGPVLYVLSRLIRHRISILLILSVKMTYKSTICRLNLQHIFRLITIITTTVNMKMRNL